MNVEQQLLRARRAIRESLENAKRYPYTTNGRVWRQIIASLAFEKGADLSLIQDFDEQESARFREITQAFIDGIIPIGDLIDLYLEFFPRPKDWSDFDDLPSDHDGGSGQ